MLANIYYKDNAHLYLRQFSKQHGYLHLLIYIYVSLGCLRQRRMRLLGGIVTMG